MTEIRIRERFYACLVTCKFDEDRIKTEGVSVETSFSPLKINERFLLPWQPQF